LKNEDLSLQNSELQITNPYLQKHLKSQISQDFEDLLLEKDREIKEWVDYKLLNNLSINKGDSLRGLKDDVSSLTKELLALKLYSQNAHHKYNSATEELDKLRLAFKGLKSLLDQSNRGSNDLNLSNYSHNGESLLKDLNEQREKSSELESNLMDYLKENEYLKLQIKADKLAETDKSEISNVYEMESENARNQLVLLSEEAEAFR